MGILTMAIILLLKLSSTVLPLQDHQTDSLTIDQSALLAFKKNIVTDPQNTLANWNRSVHVCKWNGVTCSPTKAGRRVTALSLVGAELQGTVSPFLSNLSYLEQLDLTENSLQGCIPDELGSLTRLMGLSLRTNQIQHEIPKSFSQLARLSYIDLSNNQLQGQLLFSLFYNCTKLTYIDLSNNSFIGFIPSQIGNRLPKLQVLYLYLNQLSGSIPVSLSNSSSMLQLDLESNFLTGRLPSEIVRNMHKLQSLHLSYNNLSSDDGNTNLIPFFTVISNLTQLTELELSSNDLGGELPSKIGWLHSSLSQIQLQGNLIHGMIPPSISNLSNLTLLNLSNNRLNGSIPSQIWLLTKLERLCLSNNSLNGAIPSPPSFQTHLGLLDLSRNRISGTIPSSIGSLTQLRKLFLNENLLSGNIPTSLGSCTSLEILDLSHNRLTGSVPTEVTSLRSIKIYFNLSSNSLEGRLPLELSKMDMVRAIDLSSNRLSGEIPPNLDDCVAAELINLSHNSLQGPLPRSLGKLISIQSLDLSCNFLSGKIPESLNSCQTIVQLNLSFNNFSGSIPSGLLFNSLTIESVKGNPYLCGSIPGLPTCHLKKKTGLHSQKATVLLAVTVSVSAFLMTVCCIFGVKRMRQPAFRRRNRGSGNSAPELKLSYPRITYRELVQATQGFEQSRLIGSGSLGRVYKGILEDSTLVAVKVLQLQAGNSTKTFNRECQILKRIRHRNLMRIITACSLPDFKALVLPFMANGSLESHLYPKNSEHSDLSLIERVNICHDVAEGLAYLHHHSPVQVIHCDLKPSNILLNDDMTALVSDFGISRLVMTVEGDGAAENAMNSTANLLCGSIGYIAPEYGLGRSASTKGDVYSFGILVLEMVTRKRPTDDMFIGGLSLLKWIKRHYHRQMEKFIDSSLITELRDQSPEVKRMWEVAIYELIELGLLCTQDTPSIRPTMIDAADDLDRLKRYLEGDSTATFTSSLGISFSTVTGDDE